MYRYIEANSGRYIYTCVMKDKRSIKELRYITYVQDNVGYFFNTISTDVYHVFIMFYDPQIMNSNIDTLRNNSKYLSCYLLKTSLINSSKNPLNLNSLLAYSNKVPLSKPLRRTKKTSKPRPTTRSSDFSTSSFALA